MEMVVRAFISYYSILYNSKCIEEPEHFESRRIQLNG